MLDLEREGLRGTAGIVLERVQARTSPRMAPAPLVLGCAGMADLAAEIQRAIGVPVIDGVAAAVKFIEALVGIGLTAGQVGDLAWPLPKVYAGALAHMTPDGRR